MIEVSVLSTLDVRLYINPSLAVTQKSYTRLKVYYVYLSYLILCRFYRLRAQISNSFPRTTITDPAYDITEDLRLFLTKVFWREPPTQTEL